jgi:tetratricopeptide (TPR) repeat protein
VDPNRPHLEIAFVESAVPGPGPDHDAPTPTLTDDAAAAPAATTAASSPDDSAMFELLGHATSALASGDLNQAIVFFTDALDIQPEHLHARLARGRCWRERGEYGAALSDFHRAEDAAPLSAAPIFEIADLYFARKSYAQAITLYGRAIQQDPDHAMAHCRRGISHHLRGHKDQAESDLRTALTLDPEIPNIARYLRMVSMGPRR